jgi:hypothetical protein
MLSYKYRNHIYKFLEKYLFIFCAVADGWCIKYRSQNKIELKKNINEIVNKNFLDTNYFISYYKNKSKIIN